ncbi:hypothetical protein C5C18_09430 [Rathayibacter tritici]|uniref:Uncharacterized protein n=1 Tax=Rathayibacter tritici TaxID=33888 RepID=A0A160KVG5_9MICO|nr:hypothetical protein [Rathayibacter tritici]AND17679.1 hypothetical protein A6122_2565 [Rathayibacter tritici]PPF29437.1 hypothetical protein C5C06_06565 [Rathayibacter tritici]PPF67092.1 hypothetical protein C5C21_07460 [Rathayibacter tritici]PPG06757.1 hypothetical protein C5C18_09430 [Rathayibacter tritici]PPI19462.1 hypothetical protein C5D07_01630 [Rathayibacter tritici]
MTYIRILPKNETSQARMTEARDAVMDLLFAAAKEILQIPDNDIIVELNRSTTISFNRSAVQAAVAPDVVLTFATSDHHLRPLFPALCDRVVSDWNDLFEDVGLEVWVSLIDASGTTIEV